MPTDPTIRTPLLRLPGMRRANAPGLGRTNPELRRNVPVLRRLLTPKISRRRQPTEARLMMITEECHRKSEGGQAPRVIFTSSLCLPITRTVAGQVTPRAESARGFVFGVRKMAGASRFLEIAAQRPFGVCFLASHPSAKNAEEWGTLCYS